MIGGMMGNQGEVSHLVVAVVKGGKGVNGMVETRERREGAAEVTPRALISNIGSAH